MTGKNVWSKFIVFLSKYKDKIFIIVIILIAVFFRFYKITQIPPGLYPDEAVNGIDALNALENNNFQVFYQNNNGREGLFINLIAIAFKILGEHIWTIRIISAFFGVLTILGLYLLTKEVFAKKIALLSSFLLAISFWHVNFSRIGFRAILVPFFIVFAFYYLFLAFNSRRTKHYLIAGIIFGLGFYSYIAFRFVYIILLFLIGLKFLEYWHNISFKNAEKPEKTDFNWWWNIFYKKDGWWKIDILFIIIILVALPLEIYFIKNPQDFFGRSAQVSIFSQKNIFLALARSTGLTLGMFNFYGDANWRHNYSGLPQLFWPLGILFLIGAILVIHKIFLNYKQNKILLPNYSFLILGFFIMLLPSILTYEGVPHALRTIGSIPFVFIFSGIGLDFIYKKLKIINLKYLNLTLIIFLIFIMVVEYNKYFIRWAKRNEVADAFSQNLVNIGNYLNVENLNLKHYIITNINGVLVDNLPMPVQTIKFITYKNSRNIIYLRPENFDNLLSKNQLMVGDQVIPLIENSDIFKKLKSKYPQGNLIKKDKFSVFIIK